jgi:hypothetical protein
MAKVVFTHDIEHGYTTLKFRYTLWMALESRNLTFYELRYASHTAQSKSLLHKSFDMSSKLASQVMGLQEREVGSGQELVLRR